MNPPLKNFRLNAQKIVEWNVPLLVSSIAQVIKKNGGRLFVVGGYVRDEVMKLHGYHTQQKDLDVEVYGLDYKKLLELLKEFGEPNLVGNSFQVIKLNNIDISIPRKDIKISEGHRGFEVKGDLSLSPQEAARRRDFTINAMLFDPLTGELLDPYGGETDIKNKILRAVDLHTFGEDPLRALRAMQFAGRFGFKVEKQTSDVAKELNLHELSRGRIGEEWTKLLTKAEKPSIGLQVAWDLGIIEKLHPEFLAQGFTPQSKKSRSNESIWTHTKKSVDKAAQLVKSYELPAEEAKIILFSALTNNLGKTALTQTNEYGKINFSGYETAGLPVVKQFLRTLAMPMELIEEVQSLASGQKFLNSKLNFNNADIRSLSVRLKPANIRRLLYAMEADFSIFSVEENKQKFLKLVKKTAEKLDVFEGPPAPLITGHQLLKMGFRPGKKMGEVLKKIYSAQIEGIIKTTSEARNYAQALKK